MNKIFGIAVAVAGLAAAFLCEDISIFIFTLMIAAVLFGSRKNCIMI